MTDMKKMPVSGGGPGKGKPDGVSGTPDTGERGRVQGRVGGGESGGGGYPNPHSGKGADGSGSPSHGGQSEMTYHGGSNPNATAGGQKPHEGHSDADGSAPPVRQPHTLQTRGGAIEVVEDSGVAAAEATGKVATDAPYEQEQKEPGAG